MVNYTAGTIRGKNLAQQGLNEVSVSLHIKDVVISEGNISNNIGNIISSDPTCIIPKFQFSIEDRLSRFNSLNNKLSIIDVNNKPESKIINMIEKQNNCSLNEIFYKENSINNIIINSPLENIKNDLITILSYNLIVNLIMVYFICMLIFIFTFKFVINNNINLEKVKILPLGYYIHFILSNIILGWQKTKNKKQKTKNKSSIL
jgi:hypothetical protein